MHDSLDALVRTEGRFRIGAVQRRVEELEVHYIAIISVDMIKNIQRTLPKNSASTRKAFSSASPGRAVNSDSFA